MSTISLQATIRCLGLWNSRPISVKNHILRARMFGRTNDTNSLKNQLAFIQLSPGRILEFKASPDTISPTDHGTMVTLTYSVEKVREVAIYSNGNLLSESGNIGAPCQERFSNYHECTVNETQEFTLEAIQAGRSWEDSVNDEEQRYVRRIVVRVTEPEPELPGPSEASQVIWLQRQQIWAGYVPYMAIFPSGGLIDGNLIQIKIPDDLQVRYRIPAVSFPKHGHETADCGDSGSIIQLLPGASTTSSQIREVFGMASPTLPVRIAACVAVGPNLVDRFPIELTYTYR